MYLYVVGTAETPEEDNWNWDLVGVYSTKDKAIAACKTCNDFLVLVESDKEVQVDYCEVEWPMVCFQPRKEHCH